MKCQIEYVCKQRNGKPKYWCRTHKYKASDKDGNVLGECLSGDKLEYINGVVM